MKHPVTLCKNRASEAEILRHLQACDSEFLPRLSGRVHVGSYAKKIAAHATRFEAWEDQLLVGLVAVYCGDQASRVGFITNVSVAKHLGRRGIAFELIGLCIASLEESNFEELRLEVFSENTPAIRLYEKCGFLGDSMKDGTLTMSLILNSMRKEVP